MSPHMQACFLMSKLRIATRAGWESALAYRATRLSRTENSSAFVVPITVIESQYYDRKSLEPEI
jgi:hypothetical protein